MIGGHYMGLLLAILAILAGIVAVKYGVAAIVAGISAIVAIIGSRKRYEKIQISYTAALRYGIVCGRRYLFQAGGCGRDA